MKCYKDRTYCASKVEEHTCGREMTEEEEKEAEESGTPVCYAYFCGEPRNER